MNAQDFKNAVRTKLARDATLGTRKTWSVEVELLTWWMRVKEEDTYLRRGDGTVDEWQYIPGICQGMVGPHATT